MPLLGLETYHFRNLRDVQIDLDPGLQVIFGDNASGKTSVLEAMHVLCSAKSFLSVNPRKLQQFNTRDFSLNGQIQPGENLRHSIQYRWQDATVALFSSNQAIRRASDYAALQPVQAITPLSYKIIDDSPVIRRKFIDWGVFHVKPEYIETWRNFQRSLAQRNAMLIKGVEERTLKSWSQEFIQLSEQVDSFRAAYIDELSDDFSRLATTFFPDDEIKLNYQRGWDSASLLSDLLQQSYSRDIDRHYTHHGPQRADIQLKINGRPVRDVVSRGQKKLITFALFLSQIQHHHRQGYRKGLLLVDDLPSELDQEHQDVVLGILQNLPLQVVISCIDLEQLNLAPGVAKKLFHVKHGEVEEVLQ